MTLCKRGKKAGERQEDGQKEGGSHNLEDSSRERESTRMYMYMEWREKWCEQESFDL